MKPLVSCIVPVYNGECYLRAALDSIFAQSYRPLEVIVADDGSTDGTPEIAASFGDRVRYLRQDNRGPAAARNLGLGAARGELVAFLDADDLWHKEKLARQMARFEANPKLGYCVTHVRNFWEDELRDEEVRQRDRTRGPVAGYVTATLLARRAFFDAIGGFDETLSHGDATDWFLRAKAADSHGELMPDVLVFRRLHADNRSRKLASSSRDAFLRILKASLDRRRAGGT